ncbi:MAG: DUF4279 domain-containing protein [Planctomycetota bacterium]|nr:DUF4279 domain-containing protein [Planctomycetota bacterium]
MTRTRIRASFELRGAFDPADVTAATGLEPTRTRRAGAPLGRTRVAADLWALDTDEEEGWDQTPHVERVLGRVAPHREALRAFMDGREVRAYVFAIGVLVDTTPSLALTPALLRAIADLDATLEVDLHATSDFVEGPGRVSP